MIEWYYIECPPLSGLVPGSRSIFTQHFHMLESLCGILGAVDYKKNWCWKICNISGFREYTEYLSGWLRGDTVGCPQIPHRWNQLRWSCDRRLGSTAFEHVHRRLFLWRRHRNTIFQVCSSSYFFSYPDLSICHLLYASWLSDEYYFGIENEILCAHDLTARPGRMTNLWRVTNDWTYLLIILVAS